LLLCEGATSEDLERLGALIAGGAAPPEPDPVALEETRALLEQATPLRVAGFALVAGGVPLLLLMGTLVVVAWLVAMV
jgi:hypothetical protein